jgi:subfamily B ATP-binding cassette protein HlyB/CyaB
MDSLAQAGQSSAAFLATVDILSVFTPEEREQLAAAIQTRSYAFGDTICHAGDAADGLYIIKSGSVRMPRSPCCAATGTSCRPAPR